MIEYLVTINTSHKVGRNVIIDSESEIFDSEIYSNPTQAEVFQAKH